MDSALYNRTTEDAVKVFGVENQINMAIEGMGELIVAINHFRRGRCNKKSVQEEIADVKICMAQLQTIFGMYEVHEIEEAKINRLQSRIDAALYNK